MLQKNLEKLDRKSKRYPPIPYSRMTPTKKELIRKANKKHKTVEVY